MERIFTNDKSIVMNNKKIKVVWICHLSNALIKKHLKFSKWTLSAILRRILGKTDIEDFAQWNTNAIKEFEKFEDIELHIVAPYFNIRGIQEFEKNGIYYHFFQTEDEIINKLYYKILKKVKQSYTKNSKIIINIINKIHPDIIHMIGAENPYYSESALYLDDKVPFILTLQTLMNDSDFFTNYPISQELYKYRSKLEAKIITKADYIGSKVDHFRNIIHREIYPLAKFLEMSLAVGEDITISDYKKEYDFVYFAANISKAVDWALESFAIAKQQYPNITLHVVGGYSIKFMNDIKNRMQELGLGNEVDFTGLMPSHDTVIKEIRKAHFALLPLKIDLISGTIREAIANGLPVVTTITPATPKLNEKRESVLLSEKEDFKAMADNMCKLLSDADYAKQIQQNAIQTMNERNNNERAMKEWREKYYEIIKK